MVDEFLAGKEATVTFMPPTQRGEAKYWALSGVTRFKHQDSFRPIMVS